MAGRAVADFNESVRPANAGVLEAAGGELCLMQRDFTAERLAAEPTALAGTPERLADVVTRVAAL
jgi:hypothetical protein